ncbi:MAG: thiamine pyrophosphate-dependent dehydrogenase E1 component subunit alpha [Acidimicrobiia bacterium]|nr:thiamine pyrophosphate-dependent dehydrogenase E1 component subunit alpha [bacterium]MXX65375.1 thiamine pyrophosphate-dependent dehydrogenase E1 component subunit alpha [Acidimicrobiia bacterium]MYD03415.1 thiamine pyrophosphate-dependent dehydrogenase E1 component subunit alpha [Acidimicrobiia bacterium]MYH56134.1 thiamine pyrophosphate-dependent dehydrogenase E1 component subunit alpha [Acidimicrobiia bacterium]
MSSPPSDLVLDLHYWMRLTRTLDNQLIALWKQGRGVGTTFNQRGHEAISVGAGLALDPDDVAAPLHRDLGCFLVRGMSPRRLMANQLGRATGVTGGRDGNLHGCGDLSLNLVGFISHLPQTMPVALGAAMSFSYRSEPRVALTFVGDGSSCTGVFHESLNLAAVRRAPLVVVLENNQYAYSTPLHQQMAIDRLAVRAKAHGMDSDTVDGNDVEEVHRTVKQAVDKARQGGGPTLIEAVTMRMLGHAIHDGAEYVPQTLLDDWEDRDPLRLYEEKLVSRKLVDEDYLARVEEKCREIVADAVDFAESSPWPDPNTVSDRVYAG